jgi:DNA mismatch repair protein MutH
MNHVDYDDSSVESIVDFAKRLTGLTLAEAVQLPAQLVSEKSRGSLGNMVEEHFFGFKPNSDHRPDFPKAGLELKTTGVKKDSKGNFVAKERLVLTMIDYETIVDETWEKSSLLFKCKMMLILFYLYEQKKAAFDRKFVLDPMLFKMVEHDIDIIKSDWENIRAKVINGRAHELSEGDTFYLGACRKGSGGEGEKLRTQPFSDILAKARAYSFRQGYLTTLIQGHIEGGGPLGVGAGRSFERATEERFQPYLGKSIDELSHALNFYKTGTNHKSFNRGLATRILKASNGSVLELEKAGIKMKTVRLRKSGTPRESMSFTAFDYFEVEKQAWDESDFFGDLEQKFLFIVFREGDDGIERLEKVAYWNMPYEDRLEAQSVWEETQRRIAKGSNQMPGAKDNPIAHVRPHGRDSKDVTLTPHGGYQVKRCFWLDNKYIGKVLAAL